jgi:hypothetical protein
MLDRPPPNKCDDLARLRPPTVTDADKPLRRRVAMAYRSASEAGLSHHDALDAAEDVYFEAHPPRHQPTGSRHRPRINEMIASAINVDPKWFWKNVRASIDAARSMNNCEARRPI